MSNHVVIHLLEAVAIGNMAYHTDGDVAHKITKHLENSAEILPMHDRHISCDTEETDHFPIHSEFISSHNLIYRLC